MSRRPPKARRTPTQKAKDKADILFSKLIRSKGYCEKCGRSEFVQLQCAHWISRRYAWTRTLEANAFCLCAADHRWFTDHPTEFGRWAVGMRGEPVYREVLERSQRRDKFDWVAELERLQGRVRQQEADV
jgi:hypothetical protein